MCIRDRVDTDANELEKMTTEEMEAFAPKTEGRARWRLWGDKTPDKQHHFLIEAAEGKITLEEFMAQLSDEQLAELLGGQPNTGVANTFGFGNLPDYGVPNICLLYTSVCKKALQSGLKKFLNKIHLGKLTYLLLTVQTLFTMDTAQVTYTSVSYTHLCGMTAW